MDKDKTFTSYTEDSVKSRKRELLSYTMQSQLMESLSCGVFAYTYPQYKLLLANNEMKRYFGYTSEFDENFFKEMIKSIPDEDMKHINTVVRAIKRTGDRCQYKFRAKRKDGKNLVLWAKSELLEFDDGQQFIVSVLQDVTENERISSLLRRERQQYRDAIIMNSEYAFSFDVTEGILYSDFIYSKDGATMAQKFDITFPISYDELERRRIEKFGLEFLTPQDLAATTSAQLLESYEKGITHVNTECFVPNTEKYFRRNILLSKDEDSGHIMAVVYVLDITESIRLEARRQKELFNANQVLKRQVAITHSFSSIYFGSWEINLETGAFEEISVPDWAHFICIDSNGQFEKSSELILENCVGEETRQAMREFLRLDNMGKRLNGQKLLSCEHIGMHYGWCVANLIPIKCDENGDALRAIFAVRGIGNEKKRELESKEALRQAYEAANRANVAKTEFLSNMSHDIRTPMNAIIGMTAIAGTHIDDKNRVADCLSKITVASKHLLGLINDVLDMSKIESGKMNLNFEEFNLSELVDNLISMCKPQIVGRRHDLSVSVQNVEHEHVIGDSQRIQQVFMNLMSNAVKYTPPGGHIRFIIKEEPTNKHRVGCYKFIFEDDGIGMSPEFIPTIFEPFARANDSRVEKSQGTGLGMPITRNIVRMMNGDIKVESELNKGTKVTVTFFLELQECENPVSIEELVDLPVLVVDDDQMACETTCQVLDELGMDSEWVLNGAEAVERVEKRHMADDDYFAVIVDWKMPNMNGIETTKAIRARIGDDLPIIIISAFDWSDIELDARAAGVNAFISKPLFKSRVEHLFKSLKSGDVEVGSASPLDGLLKESFEGCRALLVEDNELNSEIACEILSMVGLEIDCAYDGKEALDIMSSAEDGYYDVVFMDVQMPVMNGYDATRAIRALPRDYTRKVPIIAMTANAFADDVQEAKSAGMNEHIAKPLDFNQLLKSLNKWLS